MPGSVVSLQLCPGVRMPMRPLQEAEFDDAGLVGDEHRAQGSIRQLLLEDEETVDALGLAPGQVKENVTLRGVDVNGLPAGTLLFIGHTVVEITKECSPCDRMEEIRSGLKADLVGRRGVYARVVAGGTVRVGDPVFIRETAPGIPRPAS